MLSREKQLPHLVPKGETGVGSKQRQAQETVLTNASYNTQYPQEAETQQQASVLQANVTIQGKQSRSACQSGQNTTCWVMTRQGFWSPVHPQAPSSAWQTDTAWGSQDAEQISNQASLTTSYTEM